MKGTRSAGTLAGFAIAAIILTCPSRAFSLTPPADWPKTCVATPGDKYLIGQETDGWPNECLLTEIEWANCLNKTKPFENDPALLAQAENQRKQECHEALLAKYPDADETQAQRQAKAESARNQDTEWMVSLVLGAIVVIAVVILVAIGVWIAAPIIIPFALLVIALHFLGCF
jgi:hypothetical protein